mmetsp:Transcript_30742/g.98885  ORF Transcript_30742/g.98885 Transcript_30742/m.98885 type:complete len:230 (+) Transcript_30742:1268-1957(+)
MLDGARGKEAWFYRAGGGWELTGIRSGFPGMCASSAGRTWRSNLTSLSPQRTWASACGATTWLAPAMTLNSTSVGCSLARSQEYAECTTGGCLQGTVRTWRRVGRALAPSYSPGKQVRELSNPSVMLSGSGRRSFRISTPLCGDLSTSDLERLWCVPCTTSTPKKRWRTLEIAAGSSHSICWEPTSLPVLSCSPSRRTCRPRAEVSSHCRTFGSLAGRLTSASAPALST